MMAGYFDDATIDLPCPQCGKKTKKSIGWIKNHANFTCRGCKSVIDLSSKQFQREIAKAERLLDNLGKKLGGL
jgi:transposase-like protein